MDEKLQEELVEVVSAAQALIDRWGVTSNEVRGGGIEVTMHKYTSSSGTEIYCRIKSSSDCYTCLTLKCWDGLWRVCDNVYDGRSTMSLDGAISRLEKAALYFASDDFIKKLEGSIGRLKKITKAIKE